MSDCRTHGLGDAGPAAPLFSAMDIAVWPLGPVRPFRGSSRESRTAAGIARRGIVPFVFASVLVHLAAVCLASTLADAHPEWFRMARPSFRRGTVSVDLVASVASPRRETTMPVRVEPTRPVVQTPADPVRRREPLDPARPSAAFAVAAVGVRVPLPHLETNRASTTEATPELPLESAPPPPKRARAFMPRETTLAEEAVASTASAAESGVATAMPPTKLLRIEPPYPRESLARGEFGVVKIRVRIAADGRVAHAELHQSSGFPLLDRSALETAFRWRYPPPVSGSGQVSEWIEPVRFRHPLQAE